jgi:hypothetical protein
MTNNQRCRNEYCDECHCTVIVFTVPRIAHRQQTTERQHVAIASCPRLNYVVLCTAPAVVKATRTCVTAAVAAGDAHHGPVLDHRRDRARRRGGLRAADVGVAEQVPRQVTLLDLVHVRHVHRSVLACISTRLYPFCRSALRDRNRHLAAAIATVSHLQSWQHI